MQIKVIPHNTNQNVYSEIHRKKEEKKETGLNKAKKQVAAHIPLMGI